MGGHNRDSTQSVRLHFWAFYTDMRRMNETINETAAGAGGLTPASPARGLLLRLTRGEPARQSRPHRIQPVGDNQATSTDGIPLSDGEGSRRTRAEPPNLAQRGDCELDDVEPAERGDLGGKASRAILGCAGWPARRKHALKVPAATGCGHVQPLGAALRSRVRLRPATSAWPEPSAGTGRTVPLSGS